MTTAQAPRRGRRVCTTGRTIDPMDHQGLVRSIAARFVHRAKRNGFDFDDLVSEGNIGLIHACDRYDQTLGFTFSTYASQSIKRAIRRGIHNNGYPVRIPDWVLDGCTTRKSTRFSDLVVQAARKVLDASNSDGSADFTLAEMILDHRNHVDEVESREVARLVGGLPRKHQTILRMRYGIGHSPHSCREMATMLRMNKASISKIETEALESLYAVLKEDGDPPREYLLLKAEEYQDRRVRQQKWKSSQPTRELLGSTV